MEKKQWDTIWINASIFTAEREQSLLTHGAIATNDGKISWIGNMDDLSAAPSVLAQDIIDVEGALITPGFVDCHTHLVYAGNRANEFEMRLKGIPYEEIARNGGGIQSTVTATRAASEDELLQQSLKRAQALQASGVTTVEIKSGYGLDLDTELKMLHVAKKIAEILPITVQKTFLGAHTVPKEYRDNPDKYVNFVCEKMIPLIAEEKLADSVDVFCEKIAFSLEQTEKVFSTAKKYGLDVKCHAEQLSYSGSCELAAKYQALSVDHLEHATEAGIKAIAKSGTVAVLLPGAFYFLREKKLPPIDLLRQHQVPIALASDSNPGTSPVTSLLIILNMACTLFKLTPDEALLGVTAHAAKALGLAESHGTLAQGKVCDLAIWQVKDPTELIYQLGLNPLKSLVKSGEMVDVESLSFPRRRESTFP